MLLSQLAGILFAICSSTIALTIKNTTTTTIITNDTLPLAFSPMSCKSSGEASNDWKNLPISTDPLPDPNASTSDANEIAGIIPEPAYGNVPINAPRGICIQHRHFEFENEAGWIRTKPYLIDDSDSDYYVVYSTDYEAKLRVWRSQDPGQKTDRWQLVYDSKSTSSTNMQWHFKGFEWKNREIMVDLNLQPRKRDGTTGEIALFSTNTFPTPSR